MEGGGGREQGAENRASRRSRVKSHARRKEAVRSTFMTKTICLLKFGCFNCPIALRPCGVCFSLVALILAMPLKRRLLVGERLGIYDSWARTALREKQTDRQAGRQSASHLSKI